MLRPALALRRSLALASLLVLAACDSYGDLTSDAFDPGTAPQSRFTLDAAECQAEADQPRNYDLRAIYGTHVERHEVFNRAFASCMAAAGYARRDWSPEIPDPYKIDPTPF